MYLFLYIYFLKKKQKKESTKQNLTGIIELLFNHTSERFILNMPHTPIDIIFQDTLIASANLLENRLIPGFV